MHESLMTKTEIDNLRAQVLRFFETRKGIDVALSEAAAHFEALGHDLTRPIEVTLEAHGVVERTSDDQRRKYAYPSQADAWRVADGWLRPSQKHDVSD